MIVFSIEDADGDHLAVTPCTTDERYTGGLYLHTYRRDGKDHHGVYLRDSEARKLTRELVKKYFPAAKKAKEETMGAFQFRIGRLAIFRAGISGVFAGKGKKWKRIIGRVWWLSYEAKGCKA